MTTHTAQEIANAYATLSEASSDSEAQEHLSDLAVDQGWLGKCRCGWVSPVDQMGERCDGCGLVATTDTNMSCVVCHGPLVELGWTLHHGRAGGHGLDAVADADHTPVRLDLPDHCRICFAEVTYLGARTPVHVDAWGRPTDPCEEQQRHAA